MIDLEIDLANSNGTSAIARTALVLCLSLVLAPAAFADLTEGDLIAGGDGLVTQDSDSGLEWLDLTATLGDTWNEAEASTYVVDHGFRHATHLEVEQLFLNAGFTAVPESNDVPSIPAAELLLDLMGCTRFCGTLNETGRGFADYNGTTTVRPNYNVTAIGGGNAVVSLFQADKDFPDAESGNYLVRADVDDDDVPDLIDNCTGAVNPFQIDTDSDGYGNACDADFDNNGIVGLSDFGFIQNSWGLSVGDSGYDPLVDCNGDDVIGMSDFACLAATFTQPPGPSGHSCAGSIPCPAP